ncbi:ferrochelatase [Fulvivirga sp. M361]|uniref:ferrochelatase n=1 Tax=Fulvivirga sp. M361 TaxID=2594266 RepID=UPI00117B7640|nr:ferrochelatase [Fulvivirga sp. M361]TRX53679.1 ferrochelatase [Fulvivirga sp. M361]
MESIKGKTGVLLINLGTPDSPSVSDVRSYLSEFLNDPRVIDIPKLLRLMLVNLIIVPFRAPKSAKVYKELWTDQGSPLLHYSKRASDLLAEELSDEYEVFLAMRYKNPNIRAVMEEMQKKNFQKIIVLTMFPQYASATTGSAYELVMDELKKWWVIPEIKFAGQYYDHPDLIAAIVDRASKYTLTDYDHILFSYHGLPERHVDKVYDDGLCTDRDCEHEITEENKYCYKATCYATTRLIAKKLGLKDADYTVCFQSRLDKKWLEPFSDKVVEQKGKEGAKKLLVFSPAFTADCLETIIEIGDEYQEIFEENGGEKIQLVESLNDHPLWISCLKDLVLKA